MSLQIIRIPIPNQVINELLYKICLKNNNHYILTNESFKKGMYNNYIQNFFELCKSHYYSSKQKYLENPITYKKFLTILRQICKYNKITYTSEIKYDKSQYNIIYYIFL